jgi:hypothetical protein
MVKVKAPRHHHHIESTIDGSAPYLIAGQENLGASLDALPLLGGDGFQSLGQGGAGLDLDEGEDAAPAGNDVHLPRAGSPAHKETPGEDPPAGNEQPSRAERLGPTALVPP